jgi:uncharacterized protein YbjT (DUF2867 family)
MKVVVLGGTGLIGAQVVRLLVDGGHEVVPAALSSGVDVITGEGLEQAMAGADVVVNLTNSPTFDEASPDFFRTSTGNILTAGEAAGVAHQVILSIVGVEQVPQLDYFLAKTLQEELLRQGPTPYSIVRATQFFEFVDAILSWTTEGDTVRLPSTLLQPMAASDVAAAVAVAAAGSPSRGIHNVVGPEVFPLDELGRITLRARRDSRSVVTDEQAGMFGVVGRDVLIGGPDATLAPRRYQDWLTAERAA